MYLSIKYMRSFLKTCSVHQWMDIIYTEADSASTLFFSFRGVYKYHGSKYMREKRVLLLKKYHSIL